MTTPSPASSQDITAGATLGFPLGMLGHPRPPLSDAEIERQRHEAAKAERRSPSSRTVMAAFLKAKLRFPVIRKSRVMWIDGQPVRYADLADILVCEKKLMGQGLLLIQTTRLRGEQQFMVSRIEHVESGEYFTDTLLMPSFDKMTSTEAGAAVTLFRRYGASLILGIAPEEAEEDGPSTRPAPLVDRGAIDAARPPLVQTPARRRAERPEAAAIGQDMLDDLHAAEAGWVQDQRGAAVHHMANRPEISEGLAMLGDVAGDEAPEAAAPPAPAEDLFTGPGMPADAPAYCEASRPLVPDTREPLPALSLELGEAVDRGDWERTLELATTVAVENVMLKVEPGRTLPPAPPAAKKRLDAIPNPLAPNLDVKVFINGIPVRPLPPLDPRRMPAPPTDIAALRNHNDDMHTLIGRLRQLGKLGAEGVPEAERTWHVWAEFIASVPALALESLVDNYRELVRAEPPALPGLTYPAPVAPLE